MCQALHELDIQSRAAESIVEDWQGPIVRQGDADAAVNNDVAVTRVVWTITELVSLLLNVVELARRVPGQCAEINKRQAVEQGESADVITTVRGFVVSMRRLERTIRAALGILDLFKSQGHSIARADELNACPLELSEMIDKVARFAEDLEWEELDKQALPLAEFKELAAHLLETGKASV